MSRQKGAFVISLDFELYWGVRDKRTLESYKENLLGVRFAMPALLKLFGKYKIHATWTIVGFLFFETRDELLKGLPSNRPVYANGQLSPYGYLNSIGNNEKEDPFHFAPSLIKMISACPDQEIGSHTFSHYYCLEKGQDANTFRDDMKAMVKVAEKNNLDFESLSFPRNQFNREYLSICKEIKIKSYRGNEPSWIYSARSGEEESSLRRALRFMDAYFNLSGHNCYSFDEISRENPFNIPSSRFLRPYSDRSKILESLRLRRILSSLTYAAKKGLVYHLWWHPHNFGVDLEKNISFLKSILEHYLKLQKAFGMESLNMRELSCKLSNEADHE